MKLALIVGLALCGMTINSAQAATYLFSRYENGVLRDVSAYDTASGVKTDNRPGIFSLDVNGFNANTRLNQLYFYSEERGGGYNYGGMNSYQQLYTGSATNPTFITGTYSLDNPSLPQDNKLVIEDISNTQVYLFQSNSPTFSANFLVRSDNDIAPKEVADQFGTGGFTVSGITGGDSYGKPISEVSFSNVFNEDPNYSVGSVDSIRVNGRVVYVLAGIYTNIFGSPTSVPLFRYNEGENRSPIDGYGYDTSGPNGNKYYYTSQTARNFSPDGSLKIYQLSDGLTSAVPEPMTWALMVVGFGIVGAAMRRQRGAAAEQLV